MSDPLTIDDIRAAAGRIAGAVRRTPMVRFDALSDAIGADVFLKCENLQVGGSFKLRGATNAVRSLDDAAAGRGVACHSSGNHGIAVALAAKTRGIAATVVVPTTVSPAKLALIREHGTRVRSCEPTVAAREAAVAEIVASSGATAIHPYDEPLVIAGQGTLVLEMLEEMPGLDAILVCVSGGGAMSGCAIAAHGSNPSIEMIGAEPALAADALESLATGKCLPAKATTNMTIADGLRSSLSERTFAILREHVRTVVTVTEEEIVAAMRLTWDRAKLVIEPSSAVPIAAAMKSGARLRGRRVGVVVTGGNVSLEDLPWQKR